jgi:hypothetical protein
MNSHVDLTPVTLLREGQEFCYECNGAKICLFCEGKGQLPSGRQCVDCFGRGACVVCDGRGVLCLGDGAAVGVTRSPAKLAVTLVGSFRELGFTNKVSDTSLTAVRQQRSPEYKAEVLRFLRAGKPLEAAPAHAYDIFTGEAIAEPPVIVTDALYAWPLVLAHYVEHHNIALPAAFENHMAKYHWQVSDEINPGRLHIGARFWQ